MSDTNEHVFNLMDEFQSSGYSRVIYGFQLQQPDTPDWYIVQFRMDDGAGGPHADFEILQYVGEKTMFDPNRRKFIHAGCYGINKATDTSDGALAALNVASYFSQRAILESLK
jgi:hypothetical protein